MTDTWHRDQIDREPDHGQYANGGPAERLRKTEKSMTDDELRVLSYAEYGLGGPDSMIERLRPIFLDLIKRGYIDVVTRYALTAKGEGELRALENVASPHSP